MMNDLDDRIRVARVALELADRIRNARDPALSPSP
jgi:hypothetical protein